MGQLPFDFKEKIVFVIKFFLDPFIVSGFVSAFIASLFWMAAMTKFDISFAYPFMSLSFILVLVLSSIFFEEAITIGKICGLGLVLFGLFISVRF